MANPNVFDSRSLDDIIADREATKTELQVALSAKTQEKYEKTEKRIAELLIKKERIEEEISKLRKKQENRRLAITQRDDGNR